MSKSPAPANSAKSGIRIVFAELGKEERPPAVALYAVDSAGKPTQKLAQVKDGHLPVTTARLKGRIAFGPDVENLAELTSDQLAVYRAEGLP